MTAERVRAARLAEARLYLIATVPGTSAALDQTLNRIAAAAAAGAGLVQLRVKQASTAERRALLGRLRACLPPDTLLLVNDDLDAVVDPAGRALADGVHLGREDAAALAPPEVEGGRAARIRAGLANARRRLGPELLLGTSVRTLDELTAAVEAGADHAGFGAMADSPSKSDTVRADPAELSRCLAAFARFPLFPIGGLRPADLDGLKRAGCHRAALGSAILQADDPAAVVKDCLRRLAP